MALMRTIQDIRTMRGPYQGMSFRIRGSTGRVGSSVGRGRRSTPAQLTTRRKFEETIRGWGNLTQVQRDAWIAWADVYGQTADPDAPVTASGRSRFVGANTMRLAGGKPFILTPTSNGIGNAPAALIAVFPVTGTILAEVQMIESYPTPAKGKATAVLSASPTQRSASSSNKNRWRRVSEIDVTRGGPSGGFPILIVELAEIVDAGEMIWVKTKVLATTGNTSSDATWPVRMPEVGDLRAMRIRPVFDFLSPQRYRIEADELIVEFTAIDPFDTSIVYDLTAAATDTLGELFARINADGVWQAVNIGVGVSSVPSIELNDAFNTNVTTGQQPSLLTFPE